MRASGRGRARRSEMRASPELRLPVGHLRSRCASEFPAAASVPTQHPRRRANQRWNAAKCSAAETEPEESLKEAPPKRRLNTRKPSGSVRKTRESGQACRCVDIDRQSAARAERGCRRCARAAAQKPTQPSRRALRSSSTLRSVRRTTKVPDAFRSPLQGRSLPLRHAIRKGGYGGNLVSADSKRC